MTQIDVFFFENFTQKNVGKTNSVVIIDDDELVAEAFVLLCERIPGIRVLGHATSGENGLTLLERQRPDLALVDLIMPRLSGVDVISHVRQRRLPTRCIVLTGSGDEEWFVVAMHKGAAGYMMKHSAVDDLERALNTVSKGRKYVAPEFADAMEHSASPKNYSLTPRHRQVLQFIVEGSGNKQIAYTLGISIKTVEKHRSELMRRLRVKGTAELVKHACVHRLVVTPSHCSTQTRSNR